jgi:hypothetical protein
MTSAERRLARYRGRQEARQTRRDIYARQFDDYNVLADADNLCRAFRKAKRGVSWKESARRFEASLLPNIAELRRKLLAGDSVQSGFVEFTLNERGKTRHIKSVHISERVVQKTLSDEILVPVLSKPLIRDNGASIKGKGVHFAPRRAALYATCRVITAKIKRMKATLFSWTSVSFLITSTTPFFSL